MNDLFMDKTARVDLVNWVPTRDAGLERLKAFIPFAGSAYATGRNYDHGPDDRSNVSALSPWVRHRLISEWEILSAVLSVHGFSALEKFIQEIFWRGYFKGWLQHYPEVWTKYRTDVVSLSNQLNTNADLRQHYTQAISGKTGIDGFDQWVEELTETGYLHNHSRMWFASIWIFTLRLPWQLGADFFAQHLLDWDPASNTLSWRWVGGLHTLGKTYLSRADNIAKFTRNRFNPVGQLAIDAPALSEEKLPTLCTLKFLPKVPISTLPSVMLITDEDGFIDLNNFKDIDICGVICMTGPAGRSAHSISLAARGFEKSACLSGINRAINLVGQMPSMVCNDHEWSEALQEFAARCEVTQIITPDIPVGPSSDALAAAIPRLKKAGIGIASYRREYDQLVWGRSSKGFFALKKYIPTILTKMLILS